jgi:hypothetical protein
MKPSKLLIATLLFGSAIGNAACSSPTGSTEPASNVDSARPRVDSARTAPVFTEHPAAAAAALPTFARLATKNAGAVGLRADEDARSAALSTALPMYRVGLNPLQDYRAGQDPHPLLVDEESVMYPVTIGGEVRSSVVVEKRDGAWRASTFGKSNLAKMADGMRTQVSAARGVSPASLSLVEVPTLHAEFVSHDEGGVLMLTSLLDVPGTDIRAGRTLQGADVLAKLQPLAVATNGNAPN